MLVEDGRKQKMHYKLVRPAAKAELLGPMFYSFEKGFSRREEGTFPSRTHLPRMAGRKMDMYVIEFGKMEEDIWNCRILTTLLQGTWTGPAPPAFRVRAPGVLCGNVTHRCGQKTVPGTEVSTPLARN